MLRRHLGTPQLSSIVPSGNPVQGLQQVQAGGVQRSATLYEQRLVMLRRHLGTPQLSSIVPSGNPVQGLQQVEGRQAAAARDRKAMNKRWGELANKMGTVVEDIVAPSVRRLAREVFDCGDLQYFSPRVSLKRSDDRSREREFDALYVGTRAVLLNETKSSPRSSDARAFAEFLRSNEFALYFPQYRELPIVPAFSSLSIPADMVTCLTRRGIYALAMGDEAMQVLNLEAVRSRLPSRRCASGRNTPR